MVDVMVTHHPGALIQFILRYETQRERAIDSTTVI